jgi:hypothetical protein
MGVTRVTLIAGCVGASITLSAKEPPLRSVIARVSAYLENYDKGLAAVVADELYRQTMDTRPTLPPRHADRVLRSDYALTRAADKEAWVGYRDTFEVDGKPLRDREDRLLRLLASGTVGSAARIAEESSRFNLGNTILPRNINVPTLVLEMLHPRNQSRFSFSKAGEETIGTIDTWRIAYAEKQHPTFIRNSNGRDRVSHGFVWVDAGTGEIWRTSLTWDSAPTGTITVTYGRVSTIDALVPLTMTEHYATRDLTIVGDATYSNYRQFQTAGRVITNE